jgi:hypothetical protein
MIPRLCILSSLLAVGGCATIQEPACRAGEQPAVTESIYFGTNKPGGVVTAEEWTAFVNGAVTPAFPEGLTSWAASGQWRMATGTIERELSHILQLTHDDSPQRNHAIQLIVDKYKHDFQQEAVLRVRSRTCIRF